MAARIGEQSGNATAWVLLMALFLVGKAIWRLVVVAREYASSTVVWIDIGLTAMIMLGLWSLAQQALRDHDLPAARRGQVRMAMIAGLGAGVVLLGLRMTGDAGWWTGHLTYGLQ